MVAAVMVVLMAMVVDFHSLIRIVDITNVARSA